MTLLVPLFLVVVGTIGYQVIERWNLEDSLYMTIITVTSVGFSEVHELSSPGRVFTMILSLVGVFAMFYAAGSIIGWVVGGEVHSFLGSRRMEKNLAGINDHVIICGYGRMGRLVCQEFSKSGKKFVIIDQDSRAMEEFSLPGGISLVGDATNDDVLERAGALRARSLVAAVASDAANLYITMSARLLNPDLFIVTRAEGESSEKKLIRAGASRVVSPYLIGGNRVAQAVLRPNVVDFLEFASRTEHLELNIEETEIVSGSSLDGQSLRDSKARQEWGVIVVAIKRKAGPMEFNPNADAVINAGDIVISLGKREDLDNLSEEAH